MIDIPELALRNVATLLEVEERGAAFLYLAERRSTLLLVRQGVLYLTRHVETGVATLAEGDGMRRRARRRPRARGSALARLLRKSLRADVDTVAARAGSRQRDREASAASSVLGGVKSIS